MHDSAGEGVRSWDAYRVRESRYPVEVEGSWMLFAGCHCPVATRAHAAEHMSREVEPWLSELSDLSETIGPLSERYRATIGSDNQIVSIGAIGPLSDYYRSYRGGTMLMHYRTLSELSEPTIGAIEAHYRML